MAAPSEPLNLVTNFISDSEIALDWDVPASDGGSPITGYKIERKARDDESFSVLVADTGNTNLSHSDTNLFQSSKFIYRVSAINNDGISGPSNESAKEIIFNIDTNDRLVLHLDSLPIVDSSLNNHTPDLVSGTIETVAPKFGAGNYRTGSNDTIRYDGATFHPGGNSDFTIDLWFRPPSSIFDLYLATYGGTSSNQVAFMLKIENFGGAVNELQFRRALAAGSVPKIVSASLSWDPNTLYHIAIERQGNTYTLYRDGVIVDQAVASGTIYLPPASSRRLRIAAIESFGVSSHADTEIDEFRYSQGVARYQGNAFTSPNNAYGEVTAPTAPLNLATNIVSPNQIDLSWDIPLNEGTTPITGYLIERESPIGGGFSIIVPNTGNIDNSFSDTGLQAGTEYNYRVSAINSVGTSSPSNQANAQTPEEIALTVSRQSSGLEIADFLTEDEKGLNHGNIPSDTETAEEILYIRHNGVNPVTNLGIYIENATELLAWADADINKGLLIDIDNDGNYEDTFRTGVGDSKANAIPLTDINSGEEKVIRLKVVVPGNASPAGTRKFNTKFDYQFTS